MLSFIILTVDGIDRRDRTNKASIELCNSHNIANNNQRDVRDSDGWLTDARQQQNTHYCERMLNVECANEI